MTFNILSYAVVNTQRNTELKSYSKSVKNTQSRAKAVSEELLNKSSASHAKRNKVRTPKPLLLYLLAAHSGFDHSINIFNNQQSNISFTRFNFFLTRCRLIPVLVCMHQPNYVPYRSTKSIVLAQN